MALKTLDEMSLEELDAVMEGKVPAQDAEESIPEPEPEPEPQAEVTEPQESKEEKPDVEAEPEDKPEPEPEQVSEDDILRAREAQLEAKAKHWEQIAGRNGGELGFVKRQLQELRAELDRRRGDESLQTEDDAEDDGQKTAHKPAPRTDRFALWALKRAAADASAQFRAQHPDYVEHQGKLGEYLQSRGYNPASILETDDPENVEMEITRLLTEHYWSVKAEAESKRLEHLTKQRADQMSSLEQAKRKSSTSSPGVTQAAKPKPKTLKDMSLAELDKLMEEGTGGSW